MKSRLLFQALALTLAMSLPQLSIAQIDVTQVTADTKTYLFSDGKTSVKTYIVDQLQKQSTCCGDEKLYLEVRIDPSGYVKEVKALTGKGECFKKSAIDIVKNIKWNNAGMTGPKTVYFEITPNIGCEGRANTYAAIAITNNPLLAGAVASLPAATPATAPEQPAVTPPAAQPTQPATQPVAPQPEKPAVAATQPATQPAAQPASQPAVATTQPAAPQQVPPSTTTASASRTQPQPQNQPSFTAPMPPQNQPGKTTTPAASSSQTPEQRMAEIQQLQVQLAALKAKEEADNQLLAENARLRKEAEERKRKEEEEKKKKEEADRAAAAAAMAARNTPAPTAATQGKPGTTPAGKPKPPTMDELYGHTDREPNYDIVEENPAPNRPGQQGKNAKPGAAAPGDSSKVAVDPNQEKLLVAQRKLMELEARNQANALQVEKFEKERATIMAEMQKAQQAILAAKEEDARKKEQAELDAIAASKKEAETKQAESQAAIERIQKEMQLLQEEIQKRMADIERFKQEADAAEQLRIQKEQEFLVANAQRNADIFAAGTPGALTPMLAPVPLPTDTSKVGLLIYQVNVLTQQVAALQNMILRMQNGGGSYQATGNGTRSIQPAPTRPGQNTPGLPAKAVSSTDARSAAKDQTYMNVDYAHTNTPEDGKANREAIEAGIRESRLLTGAQQPATPQGTNPRVNVVQTPANQAHDDIHVNTAGPTLSRPEYEDGEQGLKDYIRGQLRLNGVCGLAQAAFEVTVNPRGEVISYRVLAANTPQVISLMPNILTSLKFKQSNSRFNQNSYLEFKTEIRCDEKPSTGELERTPNYIEAPATNR